MPTAPINGTTIYYETHGEGFPLVYIHGGFGGLGTGQGSAVPAWVTPFATHFRVILYDRRSSGRSGFPDTPHSMSQFAGDIKGLLDHLGLDRAHVWGTSAGGPIAIQFALDFPASCASLVVAESAPWLSRDRELRERLRERISILERDGPEAVYEARRSGGTVGLNLFAAERPAQSEEETRQREERRAAIQAQLATVPREERIAKYASELRTYSAYVDWNAEGRFGALAMPVLIAYGTGDTVFPDVGWERIAAGHVKIEYRPFEGVEHGALGTHERALAATLEFLRRNTP